MDGWLDRCDSRGRGKDGIVSSLWACTLCLGFLWVEYRDGWLDRCDSRGRGKDESVRHHGPVGYTLTSIWVRMDGCTFG